MTHCYLENGSKNFGDDKEAPKRTEHLTIPYLFEIKC